MFFCDACANVKGWSTSISRSYGHCEICNGSGYCSNVPSSRLPIRRASLDAPMPSIPTVPRYSSVSSGAKLVATALPDGWAFVDFGVFESAEELPEIRELFKFRWAAEVGDAENKLVRSSSIGLRWCYSVVSPSQTESPNAEVIIDSAGRLQEQRNLDTDRRPCWALIKRI